MVIYLAGPLFGIADRYHNVRLSNALKRQGFEVILPQQEAIRFFKDGKFDVAAVCKDCAEKSATVNAIVANIDGSDADSGTAIEVGIALRSRNVPKGVHPIVICVRTDFRTDLEREVGINAMFNLADRVIYKPAFVNSEKQMEDFYYDLAHEIAKAIYDVW